MTLADILARCLVMDLGGLGGPAITGHTKGWGM